ncbi:MAG: Gfo/Idh/MocA family oxidoreductase [Candidatus Brocadiae bacterium]|nr:Gfo/Idh/MocA family oxidoreductase [Candidatus Brocadiia bacterium]
MSNRIKIYGAGSIGNHLAQASRTLGWEVTVCDLDGAALKRMQGEIYPSRYGAWDPAIRLCLNGDAPRGGFDLIAIGTPPEHHLALALDALKEAPRAILAEKPACPPHMNHAAELLAAAKAAGVRAFVGYDHVVGRAAALATGIARSGEIGEVVALDVEFREHWEGIFRAHPWLSGPQDTYLGYWERGGGASGEHSHALNLWQHFAHVFGFGRVLEVEAMATYVREGAAIFDSIMSWNLRTESGFQGRVVQDVLTRPSRKRCRIQGSRGTVEWVANHTPEGDAVFVRLPGAPEREVKVAKKRPDDFIEELTHVWASVTSGTDSPLGLERGLDTALVVAAGHESERLKTRVRMDWSAGHKREAIVPCR